MKTPQQINEGDGTEDQVLETGASEVPPTGHASTTGVALNIVIEEEDAADVPLVSKRRHKRVNDGVNANAPPKVLRKDFDVSRPAQSTFRGKSFASTGLEAGSTLSTPASQGTPAGTIDPDLSSKGATLAGDPDSEKSSSFTSFVGSLGGAMGSQLRLRFEQEVRLLKKAKEKVAKRDQRVHVREEEIKKLDQEVRSLRVVDTEVQGLRNQTRNLETLLEAEVDMKKAAEANTVMKCAESTDLRQAFANVVSAGIAKGVSEELKHRVEHGKAYSSQLKIHVYPEVRDPRDPWAFKEEMLLEDAIMANVSRAEKKKKCRVVCRTHGIGSSHHPKSDRISVSVPTIAPQGLFILLPDAATRTETTEDEASPRLIRSNSLPTMYNLDWP
ncbi:hypothetical protein Tco_0617613 [Tanacetum coccineum]